MAQIGRRLQLAAPVLAAGLVSAVLAARLIIYGAMYWEHTLAVALAFWGVSMALFPKKDSLGLMEAIAAGILVGLSVWFRPEFLCLVAILGGLLAVSVFKIKSLAWLNPAPGRIWAFGLAMVATVLIFFGLNMVIYGHPLGIHALQIVEESSLKQQVKQAIASYRQLVGSLVSYFPLVWFVMAMAIAGLWITPLRLNPRSRLVLLLCGAFVLMVPLIIPPGAGGKQWGPRYYLVLVPLLSLLAAQQLQQSWRLGGRIRYLPVVLLAATCFLGIYGNLYGATWGQQRNQTYGSVPLSGNYGPIAPAIAALAEQDSSYLAMSHQFVAQQLWPALPDKIFFRTETAEATQTLGAGLLDQGIEQFIYICYPHRDCPVPELPGDELTFRHRDGTYRLEFSLLGELGKYPTHRVDLVALE